MQNKKLLLPGILPVILFLVSCEPLPPTDLTKTPFIPKPVSITATEASFQLKENTTIYFPENDSDLQSVSNHLAHALNNVAGFIPEVQTKNKPPRKGIWITRLPEADSLGAEGYILTIDKKRVTIAAPSPAGCFYGVQSLLQTLPKTFKADSLLNIPTGTVADYPHYEWRGAMLDVSRHFFEVPDVKRFMDFLSAYKMNRLHMHLSDDQGWRIEIKSWPKLTEIGGSTEVGGGPGGFYTQEEFSDLVAYARERFITIVPEIDMPGHTNAALASYAELNCDEKARNLYTGTRVGFSTLCTQKEITYEFINDVVSEISALYPGDFFHIGGDESHVTEHDDYVYFINRVQEIVASHGKKVIGWDDIAAASLIQNSAVQFWANAKNTTMGIQKGAKVVMSPAKKAYLDMKYDSSTVLGLNWAGYIEVDKAYNWEPMSMIPELNKENILGVEAPLWSETVTNIDELEFMVFPRLIGYAEIGWSQTEKRNWIEYKDRLAKHGKRMDDWDINYYKSPLVNW